MRREYFIQGKGKYCSKLKKGKLKTKKLLKITRYISWTRALGPMSRASLKLRKYVFTKTWKVAVTAYLKINSGLHARKNPKQQYLKVVTFSDPSSSKKAHLCLQPCSLDTRSFFIRKTFIRTWASKTLKLWENVIKISSLKCLSCNF